MAVKPIPDGYHTVTPYIVCNGAADVIRFVKEAFGATEQCPPMTGPDGTVHHAELKIGDSPIMLSEACGEQKAMPAMIYLYVEDVDKVYAQAIKAGGKTIKPVENQFYGDRSGGVSDNAGNQWWIGTHVEDVSPEELRKRAAEKHKEKVAK